MLTTLMPALTQAFQGILPPNKLKQLTQALGNCNADLTHRGDVKIQPDGWTNVFNDNGYYENYAPTIQEYNTYVTNIDDGLRDVSPSISNQYNTNIDYGDVITNIYNGPPGPPGRDGAQGTAGVDGAAGAAGAAGPPGSPGAAGANGRDGRDGTDGRDGAMGPSGPPGARGAAGPAGKDGRDGTDGADGMDGRDGVVDIDGLIQAILARLREKPAIYSISTNDEQVSYVTKRSVTVMVDFDTESCEPITETIEVIDEIVPKFVVKKVNHISGAYYGP